MNFRTGMLALAALLVAAAVAMPTGWYESIPRNPSLPLPFSGATLLRLTFVIEALAVAAIAVAGVRFTAMKRNLVASRIEMPFDIPQTPALAVLAAVTALALALRIHGLDQDLWLDEITPIVDYTGLSAVQVLGSYLRSNNHLINTLLLKGSISLFGESEWSVRLPAMLFGTATIPAIYWVSRIALSRLASLGAALMLTGSFHHVFFSQNARGYTAYLLFALLSTALLVAGLRRDELWRWGLYIATVVLGAASLLITSFVLAGHVIVCVAIGVTLYMRKEPVTPLARRVAAVLGIAGFLVFQIYSAALPEAYVVLTTVYEQPATGYPPFSAEFVREMVRGLVAGFGSPLVATSFLLVGAAGFSALACFCWPLAAGLLLPAVLTAGFLGARQLTFSPRFFLILLPLAMIAAASALQGLMWIWWKRRLIGTPAARVLLAASAAVGSFAAAMSLPYYYSTPKQPYRAAMKLAEARYGKGNIVIVAHARDGFQYYVRRVQRPATSRYVYTRTLPTFDSLTERSDAGPPQVLTTFSRALRLEFPEIEARLRGEWQVDTTFAATVGDGEITAWSRKVPVGSGTTTRAASP